MFRIARCSSNVNLVKCKSHMLWSYLQLIIVVTDMSAVQCIAKYLTYLTNKFSFCWPIYPMVTLGLLLQNETRRIHCDPQIGFTICHEHACAACPTHVCCCIWRKRVYVIANEGFGLGDGTGPAEESKRTKRVQGWSRQIGLGTLFAIRKLFSI